MVKRNKVIKVALGSTLVLTGLANIGVLQNKTNVIFAAKNQDGVCEVEVKDGSINFTVDATTSTEVKPRSIFTIMDFSGSVYNPLSAQTGQSRTPTFAFEIDDLITIVESMRDNEEIMLSPYIQNNLTDSYSDGTIVKQYDATKPQFLASKMLTKAEAIDILTTFQNVVANSSSERGGLWRQVLEDKGKLNEVAGSFEEIYDANRDKSKTPVVLQLTDEWIARDDNGIDTSFAQWSKANARTFMSIVYSDSDNPLSVEKMTEAGHPNIFVATIEDSVPVNTQRKADILKQIEATTVETTTLGGAKLEVTAPTGVTLKEVKLVDANGKEETLAIQNNAVSVDKGELNGTYTLKVKAEGIVKEKSSVTMKATVGKSAPVTGTIDFEPCADDVKGTDQERTTENIDFKTIYEDDDTLKQGEEKVKTEGVVGVREILKVWQTVNGQRVGEPVVTSSIITEVVDQVILRGTQVKKDFTYRVIDANNKEKVLIDTTKVTDGYKGEAYKLDKLPTLDGYEIKVPEGVSLEGTFNGEPVNIDLLAYEVKPAPVKVKFVDENGKELQKEVDLLKKDSKLDGDYSFTPEKRIKVGNDEYALEGIELKGKTAKEIKGKFGKEEVTYNVKYKKVVKPAPQKLPKTSADNTTTNYGIFATLLGLLSAAGTFVLRRE